jgi:hypothetical protein
VSLNYRHQCGHSPLSSSHERGRAQLHPFGSHRWAAQLPGEIRVKHGGIRSSFWRVVTVYLDNLDRTGCTYSADKSDIYFYLCGLHGWPVTWATFWLNTHSAMRFFYCCAILWRALLDWKGFGSQEYFSNNSQMFCENGNKAVHANTDSIYECPGVPWKSQSLFPCVSFISTIFIAKIWKFYVLYYFWNFHQLCEQMYYFLEISSFSTPVCLSGTLSSEL